MRFTVLALCAIFLAACSSGPAASCDTCATAEATPAGDGSAAAAAAASGGQRASQTSLLDDTARLSPQTTINRGTGANTASSADSEVRHGVTGGAQNAALVVPTSAEATASAGGGVSAAVQSARANVDMWRSQLALVMSEQPYDPTKADFVRTNLASAQADLNAAEAAQAATRPSITNNYFPNQQGSNTVFAVSSSSTDGQPSEAGAENAGKALIGVTEATNAESNFPGAAPAGAESPGSPPAGPAGDPLAPEDE